MSKWHKVMSVAETTSGAEIGSNNAVICEIICASMSKWISVDERLPEKGEPVLCALKDRTLIVSYFDVSEFSGAVDWYYPDSWINTDSEDFTHWMPLPPLPNSFEDLCNKKHPAT